MEEKIEIQTEWDFFPNLFCSPNSNYKDLSNDYDDCTLEKPQKVNLQIWNPIHFPFLYEDNGNGYGTYQLKIQLPIHLVNPGLKIPIVYTSYRIFINGDLIYELGKVSRSSKDSKPDVRQKIIPLPLETDQDGYITLVFHVSNFHDSRGGIFSNPMLGKYNELIRDRRKKHHMLVFFIGAILFMGTTLFLVYIYTKQVQFLALTFFCFMGAMYIAFIDDTYWYFLYPETEYELKVKLEMGFGYFVVASFFHYFYSFLKLESSKIFPYTYIIINYALGIVTFFMNLNVSTQLNDFGNFVLLIGLFYVLFILLFRWKKIHKEVKFMSVGFVSIAIITLGDLLRYYQIYDLGTNLSLGIFIFLGFQSHLLVYNLIENMKKSKNLLKTVSDLNLNLENKVKQRTKELEKEKNISENANRLKDKFISLLVHDIQSPLQGVVNASSAIINRTRNSISIEEILNVLILHKSTIENVIHMSKEILDYNRFKMGSIVLKYEMCSINQMIELVLNQYRSTIKSKGIETSILISDEIIIVTDRVLFQECIHNLISNAIKYTPELGSLKIECKRSGNFLDLEFLNTISSSFIPEEIHYFETRTIQNHSRRLSGFGLPITKEIIDILKCSIVFDSSINNTFVTKLTVPNHELIAFSLEVGNNELEKNYIDNFRIITFPSLKNLIENAERVYPDKLIIDKNHPESENFILQLQSNSYKGIPVELI